MWGGGGIITCWISCGVMWFWDIRLHITLHVIELQAWWQTFCSWPDVVLCMQPCVPAEAAVQAGTHWPHPWELCRILPFQSTCGKGQACFKHYWLCRRSTYFQLKDHTSMYLSFLLTSLNRNIYDSLRLLLAFSLTTCQWGVNKSWVLS